MNGFQTRNQNKVNPSPHRLEIHILLYPVSFESYFIKWNIFQKKGISCLCPADSIILRDRKCEVNSSLGKRAGRFMHAAR